MFRIDCPVGDGTGDSLGAAWAQPGRSPSLQGQSWCYRNPRVLVLPYSRKTDRFDSFAPISPTVTGPEKGVSMRDPPGESLTTRADRHGASVSSACTLRRTPTVTPPPVEEVCHATKSWNCRGCWCRHSSRRVVYADCRPRNQWGHSRKVRALGSSDLQQRRVRLLRQHAHKSVGADRLPLLPRRARKDVRQDRGRPGQARHECRCGEDQTPGRCGAVPAGQARQDAAHHTRRSRSASRLRRQRLRVWRHEAEAPADSNEPCRVGQAQRHHRKVDHGQEGQRRNRGRRLRRPRFLPWQGGRRPFRCRTRPIQQHRLAPEMDQEGYGNLISQA